MQMRSQFIMRPKWTHMNLINCLVSKPARIARPTPQAGSATWYVIQFRARTAILAAESRTQRMWACPINVRSRCHQWNFVANKMLFIPCFLSYLILHFRTYYCLGSKETTTWTTYVYSYCSVLCRESCRPCRWAVRLRGGVGPGFHGKYFADTNLYDFIDLYSVSVIALKCAISCYMGLRYNTTLVISFIMSCLCYDMYLCVCVCVCVWHAELVGCSTGENWPR